MPVNTSAPANAGPTTSGDVLRKLGHEWFLLVVGLILGVCLGGTYSAVTTKTYSATAYLLAVPADASRSESTTALGYAQAYAHLATDPAVLEQHAARTRVPIDVTTIAGSVTTTASPNVPLIALTARRSAPKAASDEVNLVADALTSFSRDTTKDTGLRLQLLSRAVPPTAPSGPSSTICMLVGGLAGLVIMVFVALAMDRRASPEAAAAPVIDVDGTPPETGMTVAPNGNGRVDRPVPQA